MFSMYNRIGKQLSRPMILAQPRACFSFGQIRKKDENGNIIEPETEEEAKPAELTPEQQAAIQKVIRARIESQLKEAYKVRQMMTTGRKLRIASLSYFFNIPISMIDYILL